MRSNDKSNLFRFLLLGSLRGYSNVARGTSLDKKDVRVRDLHSPFREFLFTDIRRLSSIRGRMLRRYSQRSCWRIMKIAKDGRSWEHVLCSPPHLARASASDMQQNELKLFDTGISSLANVLSKKRVHRFPAKNDRRLQSELQYILPKIAQLTFDIPPILGGER